MPTEGQTAVNKKTGQRAVYQGGQWVAMPSAQAPLKPDVQRDVATLPYAVPKITTEIASTQVNTEGNRIDNSVKSATAADAIKKAEAEARKAVADAATAEAAASEAVKKGKGPDIDALNAARADALRRLELVRSLRERSHDFLATGVGSNVARMFDGTTATDVNADVNTLAGAGALQTIMDMSAANGGKNPLTPLSEGDVKMIRESVTNLDPSQSDVNFRKNLDTYEDIYGRALSGIDSKLAAVGAPAPGGQNPGGQAPLGGAGGAGGGPRYQQAQGAAYSTPADMRVSNAVYAAMPQGLAAMIEAARANDYEPSPSEVAGWRKSLDEGKRKGMKPGLSPLMRGQRGQSAQQFGNLAASPLGSFGIGAANTFAMGGLDEITGAVNSIGSDNSMADEIAYADFGKRASGEANPGSYLGGQLFGGFTQGAAAIKAVPGLLGSIGTLPRIMGAGAAYGGTEGALEGNSDRLGGAAIGAGIGAAGGAFGAKAVAPAADALMRTKGGQMASEGVRGLINRFGGDVAPTPNVPSFAPGERVLPRFDQAEMTGPINNLRDADRLGLPYALADADPKLRMLSGSVARKSPDARELAESTFEPRARGQAERAYDAVDTRLAPVTDIAERSAQWKQAAQTASAPYYQAGMQRAAPVDDRVAAFLQTPAGKQAVQEAYTIAGNEGRDPLAMGFDLNEQGEVFIRDLPSYETLDLVKRGFDQQLQQFRNPMTGRLDLEGNPQAGALEGLRQRFLGTLDDLNPDYKAARGAYSEQIRNRDALQRGAKAPAMQVKPRDLPRMTEGMDPTGLGEFRRGYATTLSDNVNDVRLGANPYERIYGTPNQQAKIGATFPGAPDFDRQYGLERDMQKTFTETLGGSQTAPRMAADQMFEGPGMTALDAGTQIATGGGFSPVSGLKLAGRMLGDNAKLGMGRKKADALAPVLFNTDPRAVLNYIDSLARKQIEDGIRKQTFKRRGGLLGSMAAPTLILGSE